jgi:hypothetical protein
MGDNNGTSAGRISGLLLFLWELVRETARIFLKHLLRFYCEWTQNYRQTRSSAHKVLWFGSGMSLRPCDCLGHKTVALLGSGGAFRR